MIPRQHKTLKAVALFLSFAVAQVCVQTSAGGWKAFAQDAAARAAQNSGVLSTTGNRNILADKTEANSGATILDGMTLETSACVGATVRWGNLEEVSLGTNTVAVINHSDGKTRVVLRQGCARATGGRDAEMTIETPDGRTTTAALDGSERKSAQVCFPSGVKSDFNPSCLGGAPLGTASTGAVSTTGGVLAGAIGEIALIIIAIVKTQGDNPSPTSPS